MILNSGVLEIQDKMEETINSDKIMSETVEKIKSFSNDNKYYKRTLIGFSIAAIIFYAYRYYRVSKTVPYGRTDDLKSLTKVIIGLSIWNFILSCCTESTLIDFDGLLKYLKADENLPRELGEYFINEEFYTALNFYCFKRDARLFVVSVVPMVSLHVFSTVISQCIEYISFVAQDEEKYPGRTEPRRKSKSVSFNHTLTTYLYLDKELSVTDSKVVNNHQTSVRWIITKYSFLFVLVLIPSVCIIPNIFLFNTTSIIFQYSNMTIRSDHIFYSILMLFVFDVCLTFKNVANHPSVRNFPQFTSILTRFIWCYICWILAISLGLMISFNDVLVNLIKLVAIGSSPKVLSLNYPLQFVTLVFINYITHSTKLPCSVDGNCSQQDLSYNLSKTFVWLQSSLNNCWIVLNLSCFVFLPIFIWIIIVELKIARS